MYERLIGDPGALRRALAGPRPTAFRINRLKTTVERVTDYLDRENLTVREHPCLPTVRFWTASDRPASSCLLHWLGAFYIQDPVSLVPVEALSPRPGELVLDLCAAPGGKSLYLAERVGPGGAVVANEPVGSRRRGLSSNLQRLGGINVRVTSYNGENVPESRSFSAILVDAPCTGEGTVTGEQSGMARRREEERRSLTDTQWRLLRKAYRLLAPGGRLVYATCSYAPEENEAHLARLLDETEARLEVPELDLPHDPGTAAWRDERYGETLRRVWRCYPHHYGGGGMVLGRVRKPDAGGERP